MYERFTDRVRKVMQLANEEAQRFRHEYIGTEHILLALIKEGTGAAGNVLKNLGLELRRIRIEVERIVLPGPDQADMSKLPETPRAKKVIEGAIAEARSLGHNYVGTEHLLLGLLREGDGVAAQVLMNLGMTLSDVRAEVLRMIGRGPDVPDVPHVPHVPHVPDTSFSSSPLAEPAELPSTVTRAISVIERLIDLFQAMKEDAVSSADFERAADIRDQEYALKKIRQWLGHTRGDLPPITDIEEH